MRLKNDASDSLSYEWECTANPEHTAETLSEKSGTAVDLGLIGTGVVSLLVTGVAPCDRWRFCPCGSPCVIQGDQKALEQERRQILSLKLPQ